LTFRGTFEHSLDAKHRLTIPAKFRSALADGVVLAPYAELPGAPRTLAIWTPEGFDEFMAESVGGRNPAEPDVRKLKRFYFNYSADAELDNAHRVMIPNNLMEFAGLDKEVTVTGSGECLEVWDRARHRANLEQLLIEIPELTASLGNTP
jgi:transcriptional regulator MraZ